MVQTNELATLYPLSRIPDAEREIDIILIPGVGTAKPRSWCDDWSIWTQSLVETLPSGAQAVQIWSFEYSFDRSVALVPQIFSKGQELARCISDTLSITNEGKTRPLIFLCHSLGGLILKKVLSKARLFYLSFLHRIQHIIFLSTPHIGRSSVQDYNIVDLVLRTNHNAPGRNEVQKDDNAKILELCLEYESAKIKVPTLQVFENVPTKLQSNRWIKFRKPKHPAKTIVVGRTLVSDDAKGEQVISVDAAHNDTCRLAVGSPVYFSIHRILSEILARRAALKIVGDDTEATPAGIEEELDVETGPDLDLLGSHAWAENDAEAPGWNEVSDVQADSASESAAKESPRRALNLPLVSRNAIDRNPGFFERRDVLELIDEYLLPPANSPPSTLSTFALCGMGGLGKTQIAIEYLFTRAEHFDAVFWLSADDKTILAQNMARIAIDLGLEDEDEGAQNLTLSCERVLKWLADPVKVLDDASDDGDRAKWLIVFDNADDPQTLDFYFPRNGIGSVLMTSRDPNAKNRFQGPNKGLDLPPFSTEHGALLLEQLTQGQPLSNHDNSLESVSKLLGGLPLAITQMAHIMVDHRLSSYGDFLELYKREGAKKLYKMEGEDQPFDNLGYNRTLATVWTLDRLAPEALALFRVISLLDPDRIPEMILRDGKATLRSQVYPKDLGEYFKARAQLIKSSLVTINNKQKALIVHRVVQDEIRAEMDKETFQDTFKDAVNLLVEVWPFQTLQKRHDLSRKETCEKLFSSIIHLKRMFDDVPEKSKFQPDNKFADLLNDLGWYLLERGFVQDSKAYYQLSQRICENSPDRDTEEVSLTLRMAHNNQTTAAAETNERKDCLKHSLIWMRMFQERKTPDNKPLRDYELGIVYNETGVAYGMNEKWDLAENYFLQSIQVMKEQDMYEDTMLGWPEPNLGLIYWIQGRYDEAEAVLNEILDIHALAFGVDDTQSFKTGKILHALGNLLWSQGRMEESLDRHQRAFNQYMVTLGSGHHRTADVRHRLAMHHLRLHQLGEAEAMINAALDVFKSGPYHNPEVARSTFKKSHILAKQGRKAEAEQDLRTAAQLYKGLVLKSTKSVKDLVDEDFDALPIFWSR